MQPCTLNQSITSPSQKLSLITQRRKFREDGSFLQLKNIAADLIREHKNSSSSKLCKQKRSKASSFLCWHAACHATGEQKAHESFLKA